MNNFTPRAQQVLALARKEADRFNHNYVGTEHLLLGLIKLGQGVAVNVLQRLSVNLEAVRMEVEKAVGTGPEAKQTGNLPVTATITNNEFLGNAAELLRGADIVIDGSDSFTTRFDVNAACHALSMTLVSGAVGRWSAQVSVFKSGHTKGRAAKDRLPCYRCLVSEMPETEETCAAVGVVGPLTGIVGARMALEAVKEITGAGQSMAGRLWLFDGLSGDSRNVALRADPACMVCGER
mgnify:CR=1 FL=1